MASAVPVLSQRYVSAELIGHGGMAEVFRATDCLLGRIVALKVLGDRFAADRETRIRFMREARTAAALSGTRNIVTVFDVGELSDGRPYIVMELLGGGSVADRLREATISGWQALDWLEQAARGLDAAHAVGIVHRDIKPANLMLSLDREVKVTDFGIARAAVDASITSTGTILGTSGYMSPEQAMGERATPASDRYALAVVAFELLTGRRPFEGDSQVTEAFAHAHAPIPSASAFNRELPPLVDSVLAGGLAKDPLARPESCARLVDSLRRACQYGTDVTRRIALDGGQTPPVLRPQKRQLLWVGIACLALLAAAGAAFASLMSRGESRHSVQTIVRTQTVLGKTQIRTVTVEAQTSPRAPAAPPTRTASEPPQSTRRAGATLNDEGYRHLRNGDVEAALPLLERAVSLLSGSGSIAEAYASYNLALARYSVGRCDGLVELLNRSEQLQGNRSEIKRLRKETHKRCDN